MKIFLATAILCGTAIAAGTTLVPSSAPNRGVQKGFALGEPLSAPELSAPVFDLLSMAETGDLLIAGRASPNSNVDILADAGTLATVVTGDTGDFIYTHKGAPRSYRLRLRAGDRMSKQMALAKPPQADRDALIKIVAANVSDEPPLANVTIEAVETEGGDLLVAGRARKPGRVRVFVGSEFIGETLTTPDRRYLLQRMYELPRGRHDIRAELLEPSGDEQIARATIELLHEPSAPIVDLEDDPDALRTGTSIIIRRGDSLWRISRRAYGKGLRYKRIFEANRAQIADPDRIFAGQVFRLPDEADR